MNKTIASKKAASKKAAAIMGDVLVIAEKNGEAITYHNAAAETPISPAEVKASIGVQSALCFNLLAGRVHSEIVEAFSKRGGIRRLFPSMANADHAALKSCLAANTETLRNGWDGHCAKTKRVRGITLQALAKSIREPSAESGTTSVKDRFVELWEQLEKENAELAASDALKGFFDLYADVAPVQK